MDTFQITVLSIATIVLIGILIVVGMLMKKENKSVPFPPVSADCPDGWETSGKMCIPAVSNSGVFNGAKNNDEFISEYLNNKNTRTSKDFKKYTPGYAFCKTNTDGAANPTSFQTATEGQCNAITDAGKKQECLRCLSLPTNEKKDGILMTDELWAAGGKSARCAKKAWANRFGFTWDGVSNYNSC